MRSLSILILLFVATILPGCEKNYDADSMTLRYGTSFGYCVGYCNKEILITRNQIKFTKSGWRDSVKSKTCTKPLSEKQRSLLVNSVDYRRFTRLASVIGCPDCADGGAEWIEIESGGRKHRVTFEYGHEPSEVQRYIAFLRENFNSFSECD